MALDLARTDLDDLTTLRVSGTLDETTVAQLGPVVDRIVDERRTRVVIDLADLEHIESPGVAGIVGLFKRVRALGGTVQVANIRDQPRAIFNLLRLDKVFDL